MLYSFKKKKKRASPGLGSGGVPLAPPPPPPPRATLQRSLHRVLRLVKVTGIANDLVAFFEWVVLLNGESGPIS